MQDIFVFMQQHWQLSAGLIIVLVLLFILELIKQKAGHAQISSARATHLINHENALVLDIRPTAAFATGHITGALSLPATELEQSTKKIDKLKAQPLILISATGVEAQKIATILVQSGFTVYILAGGIKSWKMDQLPLVKV